MVYDAEENADLFCELECAHFLLTAGCLFGQGEDVTSNNENH